MRKRRKKPTPRARWALAAVVLALALLAIFAPRLTDSGMRALYPRPYRAVVQREAKEFSLEEALVYGVMKCESGFDPQAVSHADAHGLMQLTQRTFDWISTLYPPEDEGAGVLDEAANIHCGCALLRLLLDEFGTEREALAAYNAGMGNVARWLEDPAYSEDGATLTAIPYPETAAYVERVLNARDMYRRIY